MIREIDENTLDKFKQEMARNDDAKKRSGKSPKNFYRRFIITCKWKLSIHRWGWIDYIMVLLIINLFSTYIGDGISNPDMTYEENFMRTFKHILWDFSR